MCAKIDNLIALLYMCGNIDNRKSDILEKGIIII